MKTKIKIIDNTSLRSEIYELYEQTSQINLDKWELKCVKHVLLLFESKKIDIILIEKGFKINKLWQIENTTVNEVRQAGFKIHEVARQCKSELTKNTIRPVGQAVGVGHMREHSIFYSDYAIKTIQLAFPDQMDKISQERQWQLNELKNTNRQYLEKKIK